MYSIKAWQRPDEGRLSRLPAWAKRYVSQLERAVEDQEALVTELLGDPVEYGERDDSRAYIQHGRDEGFREIPIGSRAIFPVGGGTVDVTAKDGEVQIVHSGPGGLAILPQVSNVIRIRSARHD